jgi:molybdenum cofactor sulfurtransferase
VRRHAELLLGGVFGNPHSSNPTSLAAMELLERCRRRVLAFFRAAPEEYEAVFTANATHALKLVGESYPFAPGDEFLLTFDNHNSVNGIREFDRARGACTTYVPVDPPEMRVDDAVLDRFLDHARPDGHNLFAYPAQSNLSGATADVMTYEDFRHCIHHEGTGAVRVSLGMASNLADVESFLRFAEDFVED